MDYSRINSAVDTHLLKNTHIIGIGAGGAYSLYESLVRSGIGKLTVFDFDTVDKVNLCRQGFLPNDIGQYKVDALRKHLLSINPNLDYTGVNQNFIDMDEYSRDQIFSTGDLFLFLTDSFKAQAFGNTLTLKYKKPAIWGGFYEKSQCAEIIFYIPGVTPACFRCITRPRYEAQQNAGKEISISSNSNTMFHSQMLDSLIGMLVMGILHNNTVGFTFSDYFGQSWNQNLIQFKCDPEYGSKLFDKMFVSTGGAAVLFNAIWQFCDTTGCPDCARKV